jgi:hypothetical protein
MEILFKGKSLDGYWTQGSLIQSFTGKCFIKYGERKGNSIVEVDPKTVGQFVGMNDNKGCLLFKGDVVRFATGGKNVEITFENGAFCVFGEPIGWDFEPEEGNTPSLASMQYCEKVGNIHDNPELINQNIKEK